MNLRRLKTGRVGPLDPYLTKINFEFIFSATEHVICQANSLCASIKKSPGYPLSPSFHGGSCAGCHDECCPDQRWLVSQCHKVLHLMKGLYVLYKLHWYPLLVPTPLAHPTATLPRSHPGKMAALRRFSCYQREAGT